MPSQTVVNPCPSIEIGNLACYVDDCNDSVSVHLRTSRASEHDPRQFDLTFILADHKAITSNTRSICQSILAQTLTKDMSAISAIIDRKIEFMPASLLFSTIKHIARLPGARKHDWL